jgi:uncharacterized membrane-anchored protein
MMQADQRAMSKVPQVTVGFWVLKIAATTLGETGGDAASMSMGLGYLISTGLFALIFAIAVYAQVRSRSFHPLLYWFTIVATTTVGTTLADLADRSLGLGYAGGSALLLALLVGAFVLWYRATGSVAISSVVNVRVETYYWLAIMCSQTLGTALGDWTADTADLGYGGAAIGFSALLLLIVAVHYATRTSKTILFWSAFVLTRPLGAVVGDYLDKPVAEGGLALSRYAASGALLVFMIVCLWLIPSRASDSDHKSDAR